MRILVAGTGSIGRRHIANLQLLVPEPRFTVLRASGRGDPFSDSIGADVAPSVDQALGQKVDLAVVCTPSHVRAELILPLVRAGIPCYVEKPVAASVTELAALEQGVRSLRAVPPTLCGCNLRYLPSLQRLREHLRAGAIGRVVRATFQAGQWLPDWRPATDYRRSYSARRAGGGVLLDLVHELDMARWLFGEFDSVGAHCGKFSALEIDSEDAAVVLLRRASGPALAIGLDYVARPPVRRYELFGDEGTLTWDLHARRLELASPAGARSLSQESADFDVSATYVAAMRELLHAARSGAPTSQDLFDGLRSARLALAAQAGAP